MVSRCCPRLAWHRDGRGASLAERHDALRVYGVYGSPSPRGRERTSSKPSVASTPVLVPIHPNGRQDMRAPTAAFSDGPADGGWRGIGASFYGRAGGLL